MSARSGPVNQPNINPGQAQLPQGLPQLGVALGLAVLTRPHETSPQFGLNKHLSSVQSTVHYGPAHLLLVVVDRGGVQAPVACLQGGQHCLITLLSLHLVSSKLNHGELLARAQTKCLVLTVELCSLTISTGVSGVLTTDQTSLKSGLTSQLWTSHNDTQSRTELLESWAEIKRHSKIQF